MHAFLHAAQIQILQQDAEAMLSAKVACHEEPMRGCTTATCVTTNASNVEMFQFILVRLYIVNHLNTDN